MKSMRIWTIGFAVIALLVVIAGCVGSEDEDKRHKTLRWEDIARTIDYQLGEMSDGTALTCNGAGLALGYGAHCKDQLRGRVSATTAREYVEIANDTALFSGDTAFYQRGFGLTANLCTADNDASGVPDYLEVCGGGGLTCQDLGNNVYRLTYDNCVWQEDAAATWTLDGVMLVGAYVTSVSEQVVIERFYNFTGTDTVTNATYTVSGDVMRYLKLDPFMGTPALGTTGGPTDGMWIVNAQALVDLDGAGPNLARKYVLYFGQDDEDGLIFLTGHGSTVWVGNVTDLGGGRTELRFYEAGRPWDNSVGGCLVAVFNINPLTRTFDLAGQGGGAGEYGAAGCVPSAAGVTY